MIRFSSALDWLGDKVGDLITHRLIRGRLEAGGRAWLAKARSLAPVHTGALRSSLFYRVAERTLTVGVGVPYGIFQEFGTRFIRPHPYIRPALNEIARPWGATFEMEFAAPHVAAPILAYPRRNVLFQTPRGLTSQQLQHVRRHLVPTSARLHRGNVKGARMTVRRIG